MCKNSSMVSEPCEACLTALFKNLLLSISILNLHLKYILLLIPAIKTCAYAPKIKHKTLLLILKHKGTVQFHQVNTN